ncbi:hypothetical protein [Tianweitania sediminis]|jgi:hypothetical protein|uniref:Uncharacterized protein n=1 Tax=Tianweitania sediminis TaxID=1502156 RepID=A0A8J7R0K3_9HYPH|nr:hypothetical protein [Tianweitania sediminis]MBP0438358.1 hypothetical protein [Tianweitania sediminis]HEV7417782.1 hypothetical protein [Tianweitania sediminis]
MDFWNYLEYAAWVLIVLFGGHMLIDLARVDSTYDNDLLTSSREGEIERTQELHKL